MLFNFGISGSLLNWCANYLYDRYQRVVIDVQHSPWCNVASGLPQGSILGPLFFVIFISDLPVVVCPSNTIALYADDCKTSRVIDNSQDHSLFQEELNNLWSWSKLNRMDLYINKFKVMRISRKAKPVLLSPVSAMQILCLIFRF